MAATLPWAGSAAERVATEDMRLAAITDIDAFSAIPYYLDILGGNVNTGIAGLDALNGIPALIAFLGGNVQALAPAADGSGGYAALSALPVFQDIANATTPTEAIDALANYDALSALPVFFGTDGVFNGGGIGALSGYDALSAIPVFQSVAQNAAAGRFVSDCTTTGSVTTCTPSVASALGDYAALSALDTFFGDGPTGQGGVFTGGGVNALAPDSNGNGGYAALSALPVFFGTDPAAPFGLGVFTGGGIGALKNYDALSGIPAYLNIPQNTAPVAPATVNPQQNLKTAAVQDPAPSTTTPPDTNTVTTFDAPKVKDFTPQLKDYTPPAPSFTPPAPPKEDPKVEAAAATTPDNSSNNGPSLNITRNSNKFTPKGISDDNPLLFGSGTPGVDNGIRGWGSMLKKAGIGGADSGGSSGG